MPSVFIFHAQNSALEYNAFNTYLKKEQPIVIMGNALTQKWMAGWFTDQEIEAILAHELCHIKYHHALMLGFSNLILIKSLSPKKLALKKLALSESWRNYAGYKSYSSLENPTNLISALIKLECLNTKKSKSKKAFEANHPITRNETVKKSFTSPLSDHPSTAHVSHILKNKLRDKNKLVDKNKIDETYLSKLMNESETNTSEFLKQVLEFREARENATNFRSF